MEGERVSRIRLLESLHGGMTMTLFVWVGMCIAGNRGWFPTLTGVGVYLAASAALVVVERFTRGTDK